MIRSITLNLAAVFLLAVANPALANFIFFDFNSTTNLNLVGSAASVNGRLRLTPTVNNLSGGAWYTAKQDIADGFRTSFDFQLTGGNGSDGFAFLIQNSSSTALFGPGGRLGYGGFGTESGGIPNSVAIQFDTFQNAENNDPSNNYISIQTRGTAPNSTNHLFTHGEGFPSVKMNNGAIHHVDIAYAAGSLTVNFDSATVPLIVSSLNLETVMALSDGSAFVGFTAGTGGDSQNHDILNWQFATLPEPSAWQLAMLGLACLAAALARFRG